jgi:hypothetical protein
MSPAFACQNTRLWLKSKTPLYEVNEYAPSQIERIHFKAHLHFWFYSLISQAPYAQMVAIENIQQPLNGDMDDGYFCSTSAVTIDN